MPYHVVYLEENKTIKITYLKTRVGTLIVATIYYNWYKIDTYFEVLLFFIVVTSIVYNPLPAMWKS